MTQFDWQSYHEKTLKDDERIYHDRALSEDTGARVEFAQYCEAENLLDIAHSVTRFLCPDISALGDLLNTKSQPEEELLAHIGACSSCRMEMEEIANFKKGLDQVPEQSSILERGRNIIKKLQDGLFQPNLSLQPAFSIQTEGQRLPGITVEPLEDKVEISIEGQQLILKTPSSARILNILITAEQGEKERVLHPGTTEIIDLPGVWHIGIQTSK